MSDYFDGKISDALSEKLSNACKHLNNQMSVLELGVMERIMCLSTIITSIVVAYDLSESSRVEIAKVFNRCILTAPLKKDFDEKILTKRF